jgi:hypothetical protein
MSSAALGCALLGLVVLDQKIERWIADRQAAN